MRIELTTETLQVFLAEALEHASPVKKTQEISVVLSSKTWEDEGSYLCVLERVERIELSSSDWKSEVPDKTIFSIIYSFNRLFFELPIGFEPIPLGPK